MFHALAARKEKERPPVLVFLMHGTVARELGRAEGTLGCEVREPVVYVGGSGVVEGFVGVDEKLEGDSLFDGEPM